MSKIPYNHKAIEKKWRENWEKNPVTVKSGMKFIKGRFKGIDIDRIHRTVSQGKVGTVEMIRILEV